MALNRKKKIDASEKALRVGGRIRARRLDLGIKQVSLAEDCGISPAYLNLIEHDRRAIGGALLNRIAEKLSIDPVRLSEGAGGALTSVVGSASASRPGSGAESEDTELFAQRFPGHARLIERLYRDTQRLERQVEVLGDRLTHDPHLSASLHNVLSSVTAIRSTSDILNDDQSLPADWLARFHRNIHEDSQRLTEAADGLVRYLDSGPDDTASEATLPQEEVEAWLMSQGWRVDELEDDPDMDITPLLTHAGLSRGATSYARSVLARYADDVRALGAGRLLEIVAREGSDPRRVSAAAGVGLAVTLRRLAAIGADGTEFGLVVCDASGTLTFRRPVEGFALPRYGASCPLWPLFDALRQPQVPVRQLLEMPSNPPMRFYCEAIAELRWPDGYDGAGVVEAVMLIQPVDVREGEARSVGTSCRICPRITCAARREPSIMPAARP